MTTTFNTSYTLTIKKDLNNIKDKEQLNVSQHMLQFFVKSIALPSNDPKLKKLQDDYFSELDKLTKSGGCSNCKRGALMRKYIPLIQEFYLSDEDYLNPKKRMELLNVNKLDKQIK